MKNVRPNLVTIFFGTPCIFLFKVLIGLVNWVIGFVVLKKQLDNFSKCTIRQNKNKPFVGHRKLRLDCSWAMLTLFLLCSLGVGRNFNQQLKIHCICWFQLLINKQFVGQKSLTGLPLLFLLCHYSDTTLLLTCFDFALTLVLLFFYSDPTIILLRSYSLLELFLLCFYSTFTLFLLCC